MKPGTTRQQQAPKFQWGEIAPADVDRYARRAGEIIAQGAAKRTQKKPRRR